MGTIVEAGCFAAGRFHNNEYVAANPAHALNSGAPESTTSGANGGAAGSPTGLPAGLPAGVSPPDAFEIEPSPTTSFSTPADLVPADGPGPGAIGNGHRADADTGRAGDAGWEVDDAAADDPQADPYTDPSADLHAAAGRHPVLAGATVVFTILFVLVMVAFVYVRWLSIEEPTTAILVRGDESHDGVELVVAGGGRPVTAKLTGENGYSTPILLRPGRYTLTVSRDGLPLGRRYEFELKRYRGAVLFLSEEARRMHQQEFGS